MFEKIKDRYAQGYIRPDQLERYVELKVITQAQADEITLAYESGGGVISFKLLAALRIAGFTPVFLIGGAAHD